MKEKEKTAVGSALGKAISKCWGGRENREASGARGQRVRERVRGIQPAGEDSESDDGGLSSDGEQRGCGRKYEIERIKGARYRMGQQFLVVWKGFGDESWEREVDLLEDGAKESIDDYLLGHTRKGDVRKRLAGM